MGAGISIGGTITAGVQDISALLPLLGTEQCEEHVGSGLADGYLYAAATPLSIFGSLGMAKAGFKALVSCISVQRWGIIGAEKLEHAGFRPSGRNLSLIMMDPGGAGCHLAETRLDSLLEELHVDNLGDLEITTNCGVWNIRMAVSTAVFCTISTIPYIHLNLDGNALPFPTGWTFPAIRALGGFLTAMSLQILVQRRLLDLLKKRLAFLALDPLVTSTLLYHPRHYGKNTLQWKASKSAEECLWSLQRYLHRSTKNPLLWYQAIGRFVRRVFTGENHSEQWTGKDVHIGYYKNPSEDITEDTTTPKAKHTDIESGISTDRELRVKKEFESVSETLVYQTVWPFFILMLLGVGASVIGYVGCFSVVQNAKDSKGPLLWICLEAALSILRMMLWSWNPSFDNADPIKLSLKLVPSPPLSTCNKSAEEIFSNKLLPLVRENDFFKSITPYTGLVMPLDSPNLSLFYTLTRRSARVPGVYERVLFITIFDHKERTTRVYYEGDLDKPIFMCADAVTIDLVHGVLHTKITGVIDPVQDPIVNDCGFRSALRLHYHTILDLLLFRSKNPRNTDNVKNTWTLKSSDTTSSICRELRGELEETPKLGQYPVKVGGRQTGEQIVESRPEEKNNFSDYGDDDDVEYFVQGSLRLRAQSLFKKRGDWIEDYMAHIKIQTQSELDEITTEMDMAEPETTMLSELYRWMLMYERLKMECILLDEMQQWEESLLTEHQMMVERMARRRKLDCEDIEARFKKDWMASTWTHLNPNKSAITERLSKEGRQPGLTEEMIRVWQDALTSLQDGWQGLAYMYTNEQYFTTPLVGRSKQQPLFDMVNSYFIFGVIDRQIQVILHYDAGSRIMDGIQKLYKANEKERENRIQQEIRDVRDRLAHGLPNCDGFWTSLGIAKLALSRSKWIEIPVWEFHNKSECIANALRRNNNVTFVQFMTSGLIDDWAELDKCIARAVMVVRDMTSLTTLSFPYDTVIGKLALAALEEAVQQNTNITSIHGNDPQLETVRAIISQRSCAPNRFTSMFTEGFIFPQCRREDALSGGDSSQIMLRFVGPTQGHLVLRLRHRSEETQILCISGKIPLLRTVSVSELFTTSKITLLPGSHFDPGLLNLISIIPSVKGYQLLDIDLYDGDGFAYMDPDHLEQKFNKTGSSFQEISEIDSERTLV